MGDETCDSKCSYDKFDDSLYGLSAKNNKSSICSYTYCYEYDVFLVYDPDYDHVNAEVSFFFKLNCNFQSCLYICLASID